MSALRPTVSSRFHLFVKLQALKHVPVTVFTDFKTADLNGYWYAELVAVAKKP
jgi:hypothetical protein